MAIVIIPTPLRKFTGAKSRLSVNGSSVSEIIGNLVADHPLITNYILDGRGQIRSFVNVFLGDEDIKSLQNQETKVGNDATISIVPAIAGG